MPACFTWRASLIWQLKDQLDLGRGVMLFVNQSLQLVDRWKRGGGRAELWLANNQRHVEVKSWSQILKCLDDGTGDLLRADVQVALPLTPPKDATIDPNSPSLRRANNPIGLTRAEYERRIKEEREARLSERRDRKQTAVASQLAAHQPGL